MLFEKRYSPIVLTRATMFCLNCAERAARFVLQEEMEEFFQATIDSTVWREGGRDNDCDYHKSEISVSVTCRNGKLIQMECQVVAGKRTDGTYFIACGTECYMLRFPGCTAIQGKRVFFSADPQTGEIIRFTVWKPSILPQEGTLPTHEAMCRVRQALLS